MTGRDRVEETEQTPEHPGSHRCLLGGHGIRAPQWASERKATDVRLLLLAMG